MDSREQDHAASKRRRGILLDMPGARPDGTVGMWLEKRGRRLGKWRRRWFVWHPGHGMLYQYPEQSANVERAAARSVRDIAVALDSLDAPEDSEDREQRVEQVVNGTRDIHVANMAESSKRRAYPFRQCSRCTHSDPEQGLFELHFVETTLQLRTCEVMRHNCKVTRLTALSEVSSILYRLAHTHQMWSDDQMLDDDMHSRFPVQPLVEKVVPVIHACQMYDVKTHAPDCYKVLADQWQDTSKAEEELGPMAFWAGPRANTNSLVLLHHKLKHALAGSDVPIKETFEQFKDEDGQISRAKFHEAMNSLSQQPFDKTAMKKIAEENIDRLFNEYRLDTDRRDILRGHQVDELVNRMTMYQSPSASAGIYNDRHDEISNSSQFSFTIPVSAVEGSSSFHLRFRLGSNTYTHRPVLYGKKWQWEGSDGTAGVSIDSSDSDDEVTDVHGHSNRSGWLNPLQHRNGVFFRPKLRSLRLRHQVMCPPVVFGEDWEKTHIDDPERNRLGQKEGALRIYTISGLTPSCPGKITNFLGSGDSIVEVQFCPVKHPDTDKGMTWAEANAMDGPGRDAIVKKTGKPLWSGYTYKVPPESFITIQQKKAVDKVRVEGWGWMHDAARQSLSQQLPVSWRPMGAPQRRAMLDSMEVTALKTRARELALDTRQVANDDDVKGSLIELILSAEERGVHGANRVEDWVVRHTRFGDTARQLGQTDDSERFEDGAVQVLEEASMLSMVSEVVKLRLIEIWERKFHNYCKQLAKHNATHEFSTKIHWMSAPNSSGPEQGTANAGSRARSQTMVLQEPSKWLLGENYSSCSIDDEEAFEKCIRELVETMERTRMLKTGSDVVLWLSGPFARVSDALSADAEEDTDAQRGHDMRTRSKMLRTKLNHASAIVSHQLENLWNKSPTQNGNKIVREHKQDLSTRLREFEKRRPLRTDSRAQDVTVDVDIDELEQTNTLDLAAAVAIHILHVKFDAWKRRRLQPIKEKSQTWAMGCCCGCCVALIVIFLVLWWMLAWLTSNSTEMELLMRVEQQADELRQLNELLQQVADRIPRERATELQCQNPK